MVIWVHMKTPIPRILNPDSKEEILDYTVSLFDLTHALWACLLNCTAEYNKTVSISEEEREAMAEVAERTMDSLVELMKMMKALR